MAARLYITLDTACEEPEQVILTLRGKKGVVIADRLEGYPHVLIALEAADRKKLLELTTRTLSYLETVADDVNILPVSNEAR